MNSIKRYIKRNFIWFLLKFKKSHLSVDSEGDYSTVITVKVLFGDMYIMQTEWFLNHKRIRISKLEKEDILPDKKEFFNPFETMEKMIIGGIE